MFYDPWRPNSRNRNREKARRQAQKNVFKNAFKNVQTTYTFDESTPIMLCDFTQIESRVSRTQLESNDTKDLQIAYYASIVHGTVSPTGRIDSFKPEYRQLRRD